MRIISGKWKGRSLIVPKNFKGRPTTDFAREGVFNVLYNLVEFDGMSVLDLFSGTGAFALECISRGADNATCVDHEALHTRSINDNFRHFEIKNARALKQDVFAYLRNPGSTFDLVFADPPFDHELLRDIPAMIFSTQILKDQGLFILEHGRREDFSGHPNFFQSRSYSNVHFSFFRRHQ